MSDIFREIDEEVQKDKALAWWRKYSLFVYGAVALIVLGVGGYKAWEAYQESQRAEKSEEFAAVSTLLAEGETAAAQNALTDLADGSGGYAVLAAMQKASLLAEEGQVAEAVAIWDGVAANPTAGPGFQGVAALLSVMHQIETGDPATLQAQLDPLSNPNSAFRPSALELSALLALRAGDRAKARDLYTQVADDFNAPPALRERATQMIDALAE